MNREEYKKCIEAEILKFSKGSKFPRFLRLIKWICINPSCCATYYIRKMQYYAGKTGKINYLLAQRYHIKLTKEFGICVALHAQIGKGLHIPHPTGIVIGDHTVIGENCSLYQHSTIGGAHIGDVKKGNMPIIGNNVVIFAGSMVLGSIRVADNVILAANSVLLKDALEEGVYVGSPAHRI